MYFSINHMSKSSSQVSATLISPIVAGAVTTSTPPPTLSSSLGLSQAVQQALIGTTGTYGIVVKNLQTGESYAFNDHHVFESGSLYKLWIMALGYDQIQVGDLDENKVLSDSVEDLNKDFDIDPSEAELTDGTITLTVDQALNQMITISHNYAAMLLTRQEKLSNVAVFLQQNGFNESSVGTSDGLPTTTAADIAAFYEKLYQGKLANQKYTNAMLDLLKNQQLNEKIPLYLPTDTVIAHKTGELDSFSHDAGIVYTPRGNYIIAVLTDTDNPSAAVERIAEVSKAVYNYFTKGGDSK